MGIANHELQFRQWLGEHKGLLVKVVRSFAEGPADQEDLFQEILLQVWLSLPNFRENSKPTTWLYRVALNTALAWKRREKKRRRRQILLPDADPAAQPTTSVDAEHNSDQSLINSMPRSAPPSRQASPGGSLSGRLHLSGDFRSGGHFRVERRRQPQSDQAGTCGSS